MSNISKKMKNLVEISSLVAESTNFFDIKDKIIEKMLEVVFPRKACVNLFYNNDYKHAYLVCSNSLEYIRQTFKSNDNRGVKFDFYRDYPDYIHEAVENKKIIYIKNVFEDERATKERNLASKEHYVGRIVFPLIYNKKVVGFIDDNNQKIGRFIRGIKVLGNRDDISRIVLEKNVSEIIIAIARVEDSNLKEIIQICKETGLPLKIIPSVSELIDNKFSIHSIRDVKVEDLLGRTVVKLEKEGINDYIRGNTILVTGGGGSIGSELCRQIAKFLPKEIIILDIYENNAYDIQNELIREFKNINIVTLIGSVRDKVRIEQIFKTYKPQIVFHAAAHKHVPLMEYSPSEAIKNNVGGTYNIAQYACKYNVKKFVLISTDKAVNPTNIMGATKRICEMIIQSMNSKSKTEFVAVRFGNVLGSNGSVVPLFKKQIENGGPVTLTHKDITRYFMTIPEAAQLVLQAGAYARGGEIFILDMGEPVKIYDLAYNLIKLSGFEPNLDINIEITGLRPGEKLYEELLMSEEGLTETKHKKIFIGKPNDFDFDYISNKISELIELSIYGSVEEIKNKLKEIVPTYKEPHEVNKEVAATLLE